MTIIKAANLNTAIDDTRKQAKSTVSKLIDWHRGRIAEIDAGHRYFKGGEDVTDNMRKRHLKEIDMCCVVLDAIDTMKTGDVRRAAALCEQIKENLPTIN